LFLLEVERKRDAREALSAAEEEAADALLAAGSTLGPPATWTPEEEAAFLDAAAKHGRHPRAISGARWFFSTVCCFVLGSGGRGGHAHTHEIKPKSALSFFV
jgi:hypothetical protein